MGRRQRSTKEKGSSSRSGLHFFPTKSLFRGSQQIGEAGENNNTRGHLPSLSKDSIQDPLHSSELPKLTPLAPLVFLEHRDNSTFAGQVLSAPNSLSRHLKAGTRVTPRNSPNSARPFGAHHPSLRTATRSLHPGEPFSPASYSRSPWHRCPRLPEPSLPSTPPAPRRRLTLALRARRSARRPRPAHAGGWGGGARLRCPQAPAPPQQPGSPAHPPPGPGPLLCVSFGRGAEVTAAAAGGGREGLWGGKGRGVRHLGEEKGGIQSSSPGHADNRRVWRTLGCCCFILEARNRANAAFSAGKHLRGGA